MSQLFTFDDWLNNRFYTETDYQGNYVLNDSENYLDLVSKGKMTYDVLNEIQNAQRDTYEYMIACSLKINEKFYQRKAKKSLNLIEVIKKQIADIEQYIENNKELHYDVILPREHRQMKIGAKFILSEEYSSYKRGNLVDAFLTHQSSYAVNIGGKLKHFPTEAQMKYSQMEVKVLWLKELRNKLEQLIASDKIDQPNSIEKGKISQLKNNFDFVDINKVFNHFKSGLVDKKYLSESVLLDFLDAAFDKKKPPKELFTLTDYPTKKKIIAVFKVYYRDLAQSPYGKQKEYAALLGDYFIGYNTTNVSTNFSR